jgi:ABC-type multidrug transport system ATPase subunit
MFGLLGPNGAGKSTLMRAVATLLEPDDGRIQLDGLDVVRDRDKLRAVLGYLPQDFGLYPSLTALEMLDYLASLKGITERGVRARVVEALLERVNLSAVKKRRLGGFSGGMRQRFGIAQALLGDPRLVIVDEPTAGLDPEERNRFLNLLASIGEKVAIILSTHIVQDVTDLCPNMAIMNKGKLLLTGRPSESIFALEDRVWRKQVSLESLRGYEDTHTVLSTRLVGGLPVIHIYSETPPGDGFERVAPNLEDVYFSRLRQHARAA